MATVKQVKIRFLGEKFQKGIPRKRFIDIGGQRFWNWPKFPEQDADGAYIRPIEFYEKHKDILSNKSKFITEVISGKATVNLTKQPEAKALLTPELAKQDVIEQDGLLYCPKCDFMTDDVQAMTTHLISHKE
jgi:hypothetical protein